MANRSFDRSLRELGLSRRQLKNMGIDPDTMTQAQKLQIAMGAAKNTQRDRAAAEKQAQKDRDAALKEQYKMAREERKAKAREDSAENRVRIKADADMRKEEAKLAPLRQAMRTRDEANRDKEFKGWAEGEFGETGSRVASKYAGLASYAPVTARAEVSKGTATEAMRETWDQVAPQYQAALEKKLGRPLSANELRDIANPTEGTMIAANRMLGTQLGKQYQQGQGALDEQQQMRQFQAQQSADIDIAKRYSLMTQINGGIPLQRAADKTGVPLGYVINGAQDSQKLKAAGWRPIVSGPDMGSWVKFYDAGNGLIIQQKMSPSENYPGTYVVSTGSARGESAYFKMHQYGTANLADSLRAKGVPEPKVKEQLAAKNYEFFQKVLAENMPRLDPSLASRFKDVAAQDPSRALDAVRSAVNRQDVPYDPKTIAVALHEAQSRMPQGFGKDFVDWVHGGSDEAKKFVADWTKMYYEGKGEAVVPEKLPFYREPKAPEIPVETKGKLAPGKISEEELKKGVGAGAAGVPVKSAITGKEIPEVVGRTLKALADATSSPAGAAPGPPPEPVQPPPAAAVPGGGSPAKESSPANVTPTPSPVLAQKPVVSPAGVQEAQPESPSLPSVAKSVQTPRPAPATSAPAAQVPPLALGQVAERRRQQEQPVIPAPLAKPAPATEQPASLPAPAPVIQASLPAPQVASVPVSTPTPVAPAPRASAPQNPKQMPFTPLAALRGAPSLMGTMKDTGISGPGVEPQPPPAPKPFPSLMAVNMPSVRGSGSTGSPVSLMGLSRPVGDPVDLNAALETLRGSINKSVKDLGNREEIYRPRVM